MQQLPQTWDAVAPTYAEDVGQWRAFVEEALRTVPVTAADDVLDLATGPGTLAFAAAERGARVSAVDFSPGMIEQARARAALEGVSTVQAAVMDAQRLDFPDAQFDAAFCLFAFFFFPDRARAFSELRRVLRPGGRALIATWSPIERRPIMKIGFDAMAEALPHLPRPTKGDLQAPEECVREMTEAGFGQVEAHRFTAAVKVESPEHYVEVIVRSAAPFAMMKKTMAPDAWTTTLKALLEAVRRRIPADGIELSAEAIFTHGVK